MFQKDTVAILVVMIMIELGIIFSLPVHATIKSNSQIKELNTATATLHKAPNLFNLTSWQLQAEKMELIPSGLDSLGSLQYYSENLPQIQATHPDAASLNVKAHTQQTTQIAPETIIKKVGYLPVNHRLNLSRAEVGMAVYNEVELAGAASVLVLPTVVVKSSQPAIVAEGTQTSAQAQAIISQLLHPEIDNSRVLGANTDITNVKSMFISINQEEVITARSQQRKDNCTQNIDLVYNLTESKYRNSSNIDLSAIDCQMQSLNFINCSNCEFAPLGKTTRLSNAYVPELSLITLPGGGRVTPVTNAALQDMYDAAAAQNIFFRVRSAYRSFEQQQQLFSNRQQALISSGHTANTAEVETNSTVAYPYHSEHHLGNTVDLNCHVCLGQQGSKGNAILFKFLQGNASDFGFVISYPQEYIGLTGYKYEPWHLRYIGHDLSAEYSERKQTQDISLEQFLHEKSLYY